MDRQPLGVSRAVHPRRQSARRPTLWEEGRLPAAGVVAAVGTVVALATLLDVALLDGPGLLFGVVFALASTGAALAVRPRDFFAVGVLPPLLMLAAVVAVALTSRASIGRPGGDVVQAVVSGLSRHAVALGLGYALCLVVLGVRSRFLRGP